MKWQKMACDVTKIVTSAVARLISFQVFCLESLGFHDEFVNMAVA